MSTSQLPTLFLPHGAGPCFFMDWQPADAWHEMADCLANITHLIKQKPKALLVISAHWEADKFTVNRQANPSLLYDYSGFPAHTYQIQWPAIGSPNVASRVSELLSSASIESAVDEQRGLDHGVFIPLKLAFPDADIPVVQLSLRKGLDPAEHIAMGKALALLRDEGVLIIGSGMSYHNMQRLQQRQQVVDPDSVLFDDWLDHVIRLPESDRNTALIKWRYAPGGLAAHPREEHLLPLLVVAGAAVGGSGERFLRTSVMGSRQSGFIFR